MLSFLVLILLLSSLTLSCHGHASKEVYIVYMGDKPKDGVLTVSLHNSMLENVLGSEGGAKDALIYSYGRSFNGFAAKLSADEAERLSENEQVVSIFRNKKLKLHTTRSWNFMGFTQSQSPRFPSEGDVIVGMLDTGIWPEHESFSDEGFGPPPAKWKGTCQGANNFTCNNKVIGARFYKADGEFYNGIPSPRDSDGHGTHTASTAAGRTVEGASFYGLAPGIARGAVPNARIAVYKVCWIGCDSVDILAAFDDAIADGVDIISVSIGDSDPLEYVEDPIAIGAFHSMKNGIFTSNSAGNEGPYRKSVANYSPWSLTVAASSIDRKFFSKVVLGNGLTFIGAAINSFSLNEKEVPFIYGGDAANISAGGSGPSAGACDEGALSPDKAKGKIVLCDALLDCTGALEAEAAGVVMSSIFYTDFFSQSAFSYPLPASLISPEDRTKALNYAKSTSNAVATILTSEGWTDITAPRTVFFSSRGPSPITPDILKPDLTAPGVEILASWSPIASPSINDEDTRSVKFNIISGTSMSCPHVSGAAAYLKSAHPNWSPAAIKSALMTTATIMTYSNSEDVEFGYGSGHISPQKALDPGLVYDASEEDYRKFLCKQGYNTTTLRLITGDSSTCSSTNIGRAWDLNYPSMALAVIDGETIFGNFPRTVTNVGSPNSTYYASVDAPSPLKVTVEPSVLTFSALGEKKSFTVKVRGPVASQMNVLSGSVVWKDGVHSVRSPLVVHTVIPSALPQHVRVRFTGMDSSLYEVNRMVGHKVPKACGKSLSDAPDCA